MERGGHVICEVCFSPLGDFVLDLGTHPLCDDLYPIDSRVPAVAYHQKIGLCQVCLTAHQLKPVEKELLFKPNYHYRASLTKDVLDGMNSLAGSMAEEMYRRKGNPVVLDVGCNDGSLLGIFKNLYGCFTVGVDPTDAILEAGSKVDLVFNSYFDENVVSRVLETIPEIDLITFTNVFAHIENLPQLLANVSRLMSANTSLVIENHYLGSILKSKQFDTFYHEHPRTYSLRSFVVIAKSMGLNITNVEFPSRYGGNIRVTMRKYGKSFESSALQRQEDNFISVFESLQEEFLSWQQVSSKTLEILSNRGPIYGKALPGRAVMLINALSLDHTKMPVVFEQPSSPKVGHLVPGTEIHVASDDLLLEYDVKVLIIWAWHIVEEVVKYLDMIGYRGEIWVPLPEFKMYRRALT
jgi:SAM-dependent methyltransferase